MKINWKYWDGFPGGLLAMPVFFILGLYGVPMVQPLWRQWIPRRRDIEWNLKTFGRGIGYPI